MGTTVGLAPGLSRKLKKVLECRTDSPVLVASLNALSFFYKENSAQARRNLRSTIQKRALEINGEFLAAAETAQIALDRVEEEVNALADCCDKIAAALSSSAATTSDIISTTERLKQELEVTTQRQEIVNCFLRDYQLSNEEIKALREDELNENFFEALSHVQEIHSNCKLLRRTHHQAECRKLGDTDNPEVSELLKMAVRCLKERSVLFKYCAEEMREQAADAHKSKTSGHLSRRSRTSSDSGQLTKSSVDALLSSTAPSQSNETPSKIFLIDCLCAIQQPLLRHEVASQYANNIGSMIENHMNTLIEKEVDRLLQKCNLSDKMHVFHSSTNTPATATTTTASQILLSEREETTAATLSECLKTFFDLVLGSEGSLPEFEQMQVPKLRSEACVRVSKTLTEAYEVIYRAVTDLGNGYPDEIIGPASTGSNPNHFGYLIFRVTVFVFYQSCILSV